MRWLGRDHTQKWYPKVEAPEAKIHQCPAKFSGGSSDLCRPRLESGHYDLKTSITCTIFEEFFHHHSQAPFSLMMRHYCGQPGTIISLPDGLDPFLTMSISRGPTLIVSMLLRSDFQIF